MKKLVLMLAVVFSMSFFACGNKEAAAENEVAADTVAVEAVEAVVAEADTCNACCGDSTVVAEEVAEAAAPVEEAK